MKIWQAELTPFTDNPYTEKYFTPSSVFFDIETTGFSAARNQVYMIGYAHKTEDKIFIHQLFAEDRSEEPKVISAFLDALPCCGALISFNGTGFDVPFLKGRCAHYQIPERLDSFQHLDILKQISRYKNILKLPNLKQKTLETFLGISRDDTYSGKDLIPIYLEYAKNPSEEACAFLKLHNYEDIAGMPGLLPLLAYPCLFEGHFQVSSWEKHNWETYEGTNGQELILTLDAKLPLPKHFSCSAGEIYLTGSQQQAKLRIPLYEGELKYFYSNYKDYYYLPVEDMAVHKSVAAYVDKNYRTQATAATCYSKKSGCFLPQRQELFSPALKQERQDKVSYFALTDAFTSSKEDLKKYAMHLLEQL